MIKTDKVQIKYQIRMKIRMKIILGKSLINNKDFLFFTEYNYLF